MSVTACFGSLVVLADPDLPGRAGLFFVLVLRLAIVGGILLQQGRKIPIRRDGDFFFRSRKPHRLRLFFSQLAAGVEAVKIQDGVENERIRAARFAAIHRIDGKEHDVTTPRGHVHDSGMLRDFIAAFDES